MKDISQIDKNFIQNTVVDVENTDFYNVNEPPFSIHGVFYDSENARYARFPFEIAKTINNEDDNIEILSYYTAGGRIRFSTNSQAITVMVKYGKLVKMPHMTLVGSSGITICENTPSGEVFCGMFSPTFTDETGFVVKKQFFNNQTNDVKNYTLYFPLYNGVEEIILGFDKASIVDKGLTYSDIKPILYYGSSITQGGCASRSDLCYQSIIAKNNNVDYINMGFSGGAKGELPMAQYLSSVDCSVLVIDYDHNASSTQNLLDTHFRFYNEFRKGNKTCPIIFISKADYLNGDNEANKTIKQITRERYLVIKQTYKKAKQLGDKNVYLIDGSKFYGKDYHLCTVDGCHPNTLGFYKMANGIIKTLNKAIKKRKK